MNKTGAPGTISTGLTVDGHVLITIYIEDGTEVSMALTWSSWVAITEKLRAKWVERHRHLDTARRDKLKKEAQDAMG